MRLSRIVAIGGLLWLGSTLGDYSHRPVTGGPGEERTGRPEVSAEKVNPSARN